ncbi:FAD-binding monooxygenase [Jiella avicenniae]|uniref:FAD-binding monooxygenase n=1 Tax=Jiella avicenniae TaxID=2907202 RepID=A0A9X1P3T8_9HYPH|nr:FAD-binding monooxygenase [Jiella avicenniae]MCE7029963.1 FAD-binding monooxygenase [Jiella avicenniae]
MQFHLDGFNTGDPSIKKAVVRPAVVDADGATMVDVLIVGCGPAGLTLAAQLAAFPDVRTMIVDQKEGPLDLGQADGIACRTMEMFQAFGFAEKVEKEAYWVNETTFWKPDPDCPEHIARSGRIQDTEDGLSEFPHVILNQARVHDFYLETMADAPTRLRPGYGRRLVDLQIGDDADGHPVTARFALVGEGREETVETVRARYVVGCDGARSAVRRSLGKSLHGDSANQAWGVMDVLAVSDFPDIRFKSAIHSASEGSVLIIPREGGYLVRLYIELDKLNEDERVASRNITAEQLIAAAQRILHPYTLDVKEVAWWSVYEIGQRLCDRFDDASEGSGVPPRAFIAGDACHTHSPKAGQGMNVSMQDSFNLGWKLAGVIRGLTDERILATYSEERQAVAKELIDFDRAFAKMFSARPKTGEGDEDGVDPAEFQRYFVKQGRFTAGTATRYAPSLLTGEATHQDRAAGFGIGTRFHSAHVVRYADAKSLELGHTVEADGRWRLFAFEGTDDAAAVRKLCEFLATDETSPVRRFTPNDADVDSVIDLRAVFQGGHRELDRGKLHPLLLPQKGRYGLIDHEKVFCSERKSGPDIFELRSVDRRCGCLVVVRPDQYVAHVLPLEAHGELAGFFGRFLMEQRS